MSTDRRTHDRGPSPRPARPSGRRASRALAWAALVALTALATAATLGLALVAAQLAQPALAVPGGPAARVGALGLEAGVALPVVLVGIVATARLAVHAGLALAWCVATSTGTSAGGGDSRRAHGPRRGPALVRGLARRAVGAGVGVGVGLLAVAGPATAAPATVAAPAAGTSAAVLVTATHGAVGHGATAADGADVRAAPGSAAGGSAGQAPSTTVVLDLGWQPLVTAGADSAPATSADVPEHGTSDAAGAARSGPPASAGHAATPDEAAATTRTVRSGDSLWSIARAALGADASDAQVAAEWPRWYAANRSVIGADPDLIRPGQVLVAPGR